MSDIDALKLQVKVLQDQVQVLVDGMRTLTTMVQLLDKRLTSVEYTTKSNEQYIVVRIQYKNGR
jgi:hypothetical protein